MEPRRFDGPSIDYGVERALRRLDRNLRVTWSPYVLNPDTGAVVEMSGRLDPYTGERLVGPVSDPAYYLWRKDNQSSHHFFVRLFKSFGPLEVKHLESDLARFHRPQDIGRLLRDAAESRQKRLAKAKSSNMRDRVIDNKQLAFDVASGKTKLRRDPKAFSYGGQARRVSSGEQRQIRRDKRELGIRD